MEHTKKLVLVSPDYLNRIQSTPTPAPERSKMQLLEENLSSVLTDKNLDDTAKMKRYSDLLQRYMTYDAKANTPPTVRVIPEQSETSPERSAPNTLEQDVLESIPKGLKNKAEQLMKKIMSNDNILSWNNKGELVIDNRTIKGSNMIDLMNEVLRKRKSLSPTIGIVDFSKALAELNIPHELIGNPGRWREITQWMSKEDQHTLRRRQPSPPEHSEAINDENALYSSAYHLPYKRQKSSPLKNRKKRKQWERY